MQPRRILSSASNASRPLAQPSSAQPPSLPPRPGPSQFPGCLTAAASNAPWPSSLPTSGRSERHLDFLYPTFPSHRPLLSKPRPWAGSSSSSATRHTDVFVTRRNNSTIPFYHASFPPADQRQQPPAKQHSPSHDGQRQPTFSTSDARDPLPLPNEKTAGRPHHKAQSRRAKRNSENESQGEGSASCYTEQVDQTVNKGRQVRGPAQRTPSADPDNRCFPDSPALKGHLAEVQALMLTDRVLEATKLFPAALHRMGWLQPAAAQASEDKGKGQEVGPVETEDGGVTHMSHELAHNVTALAEQLMVRLTMRQSDVSPRPTVGFQSEAHRKMALYLWNIMRHHRVPRPTSYQSALIRALLQAKLPLKATRVFATESRTWWLASELLEGAERRGTILQDALADVTHQSCRPSVAVLKDIKRDLSQLENFFDSDAAVSGSDAQAAKLEFGQALLSLCQLLADLQLPTTGAHSKRVVDWIILAGCRFGGTGCQRVEIRSRSAQAPSGPRQSSAAATVVAHLESTGKGIRACMRKFIRQLARTDLEAATDGPYPPRDGLAVKRQLPTLQLQSYNQLLHFCLQALRSLDLCKIVFENLVDARCDGLKPDHFTFDILLRQATLNRCKGLAETILVTVSRQAQASVPPPASSVPVPPATDGGPARPDSARSSTTAALPPASIQRPRPARRSAPAQVMLTNIDDAIQKAHSRRLVTLIALVTSSGLFLRRHRGEPGYIGIKDLVLLIYPRLLERSHKSKRLPKGTAESHLSSMPQRAQAKAEAGRRGASRDPVAAGLRPPIGRESRLAIYEPHVLTATLNLAVKAGRTGLALRLWRLIKHVSRQSYVSRREVSEKPWPIPVEAATVLFQLLAREGRKSMKVFMPRVRTQSHQTRRPTRHYASNLSARAPYTRGWRLGASLAFSRRGKGPIVRWQAARLVAKYEYRRLLERWNLGQLLRLPGASSSSLPTLQGRSSAAPSDGVPAIRPDERFYDALLDLFGRRSGMRGRTPAHRSRSDSLNRARKGEMIRAMETTALATVPVPTMAPDGRSFLDGEEDPATSLSLSLNGLSAGSSSNVIEEDVGTVRYLNSQGRRTSIRPDPFLLLLLQHMRTLGIDVPLAFRWLLKDHGDAVTTTAATAFDDAAKGEELRPHIGRYSAFRNSRPKTVGLVLQSRTSRQERKQFRKETKQGARQVGTMQK